MQPTDRECSTDIVWSKINSVRLFGYLYLKEQTNKNKPPTNPTTTQTKTTRSQQQNQQQQHPHNFLQENIITF